MFGIRAMVATMLLMGVATALIGLLPPYAAIGVAAPLLLVLLRILQGVAVGGEWGGAVLLAIENAPPGKRGLYGSVPQIGLGLGLALGTGAFALLAEFLDDETFLAYGWRAAFLVSVLLVVVGLAVRLTILETPEFRKLQEAGTTTKVPAVELFRTRVHRRGLGTGMLARWAEGAAFNTWGVFVITYAVTTVGVDRVLVLVAVTAGALLMAVVTPLAGDLRLRPDAGDPDRAARRRGREPLDRRRIPGPDRGGQRGEGVGDAALHRLASGMDMLGTLVSAGPGTPRADPSWPGGRPREVRS